jgi:hypothetical protein
MGILSHAWDVATSFIPMGGVVNKLGRTAAEYVKKNGVGIAGKFARHYIPEHVRNKISHVADSVLDVLPDGKVKNAVSRMNSELKKKEIPDVIKQSVALNPSESITKPSSSGVDVGPQYIDRGRDSGGRSSRGGRH